MIVQARGARRGARRAAREKLPVSTVGGDEQLDRGERDHDLC
ncbi:hypothetical protein [Sorangium sp. So ce117]